MKMGNRKLKALDRIGVRSINKPVPFATGNRAERRAAARITRNAERLAAKREK